MTPPYRALCAELADVVYEYCILHEGRDHLQPLVARARALLAQPEPEGPTDEELDSVMFQAIWERMDDASDLTNDEMDRLKARAVLARYGGSTSNPTEA